MKAQFKHNIEALVLTVILVFSSSCQSQTNSTMNTDKTNPLLCDTATGSCEMPATAAAAGNVSVTKGTKPVKVIYYTDPICSSCWGIEPQLRKMKLEYGRYINIEYRMGGLLPDWSYNSGGISKPADVAHHWDEASVYYQMPIDGAVWLEDPLDSSYPACIAMKAAQMQNDGKAITFMRILREALYLDKKNIAKWDNIAVAAEKAGLDTKKLKHDFENDARKLFQEDLNYAKQLGVRGFPTMFFTDESGNKLTVYGSRPYEAYENAIKALIPDAAKSKIVNDGDLSLFKIFPTLTVREYAEILDITQPEAKTVLEDNTAAGKLEKKSIKSGALYKIK